MKKGFNAQKSALQNEYCNFLILDLVSKSFRSFSKCYTYSSEDIRQEMDLLTIFIGCNIEAAAFVAISDSCESSQLYAVLRELR